MALTPIPGGASGATPGAPDPNAESERRERSLARAQRALRVLAESSLALVDAGDEQALLEKMCRVVVDAGGYRQAWVAYKIHDEAKSIRAMAWAGYEQDQPRTKGLSWAADRYQGATGHAIATNEPYIVRNMLGEWNTPQRRARALERGFQSSIALPLRVRDECVGAISIYAREPDAFDNDEIALLGTLAKNIGFGVGALRDRVAHAKSAAALRESEERYRDLTAMSSDWSWEQDENLRFIDVSSPTANYAGITRDSHIGMTRWQLPGTEPVNISWEEHRKVLEAHQPFKDLLLRRIGSDGEEHFVLVVGKPLFDAQGAFKGYRGVATDVTERTISVRRRAMTHAVTNVLAESASIEDAMPRVVRAICEAMGWAYGAHWHFDATEQTLVRVHYWGEREYEFDPADRDFWTKVIKNTRGGFLYAAWQEKRAVWVEDVMAAEGFRRAASCAKLGFRNAYTFPILSGGDAIGMLEFFGARPRRLDEQLRAVTLALGSQIGQFIQRKQAEERLRHLAHNDVLTGLPNRVLFYDRLKQALAQARRNRWSVGVMFIDVDRFKYVNDTLGHSIGDQLLQQVASRLVQAVRADDTVGRLGGDEFAVVLTGLSGAHDASVVAQKLMTAFKAPFLLDGRKLYVTASIGVTLYPDDSADQETLVRNADAAMYRAKEVGRNSYQFYTREMNARALEMLSLEHALRGALDRDEFVIYFQPIASLGSGAITGVEALLRWQHPERGLVSPAEFMPLLEETGLVVQAGTWVLDTVCRQIARWRHDGLAPVPVAVNLSARQFRAKSFGQDVSRILDAHNVHAKLIELEITESSLMADLEQAARTLQFFKSLGVRLSIDDFGTGYSSLTYLKRFPLDALKIDRSFVHDIPHDADDATITRAVISMAHSLGLQVIAEGVETPEQLAFLAEHGCDRMQGFLFARPMPPEEITSWLAEGRRLTLPARRPGA